MSSQGDTAKRVTGAYIVVDGPGHHNTRLPIKEGITSLGRLPSNDVILLGDLVSRNHARILYFNGKAAVQDMDSHNGCWVNGEKVSKQSIDDQDMLRVGNFLLTFEFGVIAGHSSTSSSDFPWSSSETDTDAISLPHIGNKDSNDVLSPEDLRLPEGLDYRHPDESVDLTDFNTSKPSTHSGQLNRNLLLAMLKATESFTNANSRDEYCDRISRLLVKELRLNACGIYEHRSGEYPRLICSAGPAISQGAYLTASRSVLRWATEKRHTIYSKDISNDIRFNETQSVVTSAHSMRAIVCAPVLSSDEVLGALYVSRNADELFHEQEVDVIEAIASLFAAGLQNFQITDRSSNRSNTQTDSRSSVDHNLDEDPNRHFMKAELASVCAVNIIGLSSIAEAVEPKVLTRFLTAYQERIKGCTEAFGGIVTKNQAAELTMVFGVTATSNEPGLDAINAARAMKSGFLQHRRDFPEFDMLELNIGLSHGRVLLGKLNEGNSQRYMAIGRAVDAAERLKDTGPIGKIVLSKEIRRLVEEKIALNRLRSEPARTEPDSEDRYCLGEES